MALSKEEFGRGSRGVPFSLVGMGGSCDWAGVLVSGMDPIPVVFRISNPHLYTPVDIIYPGHERIDVPADRALHDA